MTPGINRSVLSINAGSSRLHSRARGAFVEGYGKCVTRKRWFQRGSAGGRFPPRVTAAPGAQRGPDPASPVAPGAQGTESPPVTAGPSGSPPLPALYHVGPGDSRHTPSPAPAAPAGLALWGGGCPAPPTPLRDIPRCLTAVWHLPPSLSGTAPLASLSGSVAPRQPACAACLTATVARPRWFATGSRWRGPVGAMDVGELLSYQVSSGAWAVLGVSRSLRGGALVRGTAAAAAMLLQLRCGRGPGAAAVRGLPRRTRCARTGSG